MSATLSTFRKKEAAVKSVFTVVQFFVILIATRTLVCRRLPLDQSQVQYDALILEFGDAAIHTRGQLC